MLCYDDKGVKYVIPIYCISFPENVLDTGKAEKICPLPTIFFFWIFLYYI